MQQGARLVLTSQGTLARNHAVIILSTRRRTTSSASIGVSSDYIYCTGRGVIQGAPACRRINQPMRHHDGRLCVQRRRVFPHLPQRERVVFLRGLVCRRFRDAAPPALSVLGCM